MRGGFLKGLKPVTHISKIVLLVLTLMLVGTCSKSKKVTAPEQPQQQIFVASLDTTKIEIDTATSLLCISNHIIVHFKANVVREAIDSLVTDLKTKIVGQLPTLNIYQLEILDGLEPSSKAEAFSQNPNVLLAGLDYVFKGATCDHSGNFQETYLGKLSSPEFRPNEGSVFFEYQNLLPYNAIQAWQAWDVTKGDKSIKIGIVDSGIRRSHEDLIGKVDIATGTLGILSPEVDDELHSHGTRVAGIAAADFNNGKGIAGMGGLARIISIKDEVGGITHVFSTACAVVSAAELGADIINISAGFPPDGDNLPAGWVVEALYHLEGLAGAIAYATNTKGCLVIAGVGPRGGKHWNIDDFHFYPASDPLVLPVTAIEVGVDITGSVREIFKDYYNYGSEVIAAPDEICAPIKDGDDKYDRDYTIGTSFATPIVSGIAALVWAANPSLTNSNVRHIIEKSVDTLEATFPNGQRIRRVNAYKAVLAAKSLSAPPAVTLQVASVTENSVTLSWTKSFYSKFESYRIFSEQMPGINPISNSLASITDKNVTSWVANYLAPGGTYWFRVYVYSNDGLSSGSNEVFATTQGANKPPSTPNNPSPANHAVDQNIIVNLSWTGGDPDGDNVAYDVYFEANDQTPDVLVSNDQSATAFDPGDLDHNTHYYWQIIATDAHGASASGPVWDFTTASALNNPPNTPTVSGPTTGYTNSEYSCSTLTTDPDEDSISYRFSWGYSDTSNWSPLVPSGVYTSMLHTWSDTGSYEIRAQAKDIYGAISAWSESHEISIQIEADTIPPAAVTNLTAGTPTSTTITLTWTAPGDDGNTGTASQYDIRYSTSTITENNWGSAIQCTGEPAPKAAGSSESFVVSGLNPNTTYYLAIKTGDEVPNWSEPSNVPSGKTESSDSATVTDIDGNVYKTVKIGNQFWMAENLKVIHYRNGDLIPNVTSNDSWYNLSTGAYCNYNNDEGNVATYGRLYNWFAVGDSRNIAPAGWHVPSDAEWKQLEMYLGMSQVEADAMEWRGSTESWKMRETGTTHWNSPNHGATNESGFTALPGGYRTYDGYFESMGVRACFWSSSEYYNMIWAWSRELHYDHAQVWRYYDFNRYGYSVRCVRD